MISEQYAIMININTYEDDIKVTFDGSTIKL